jgi:hypothetical protein
VAREEAKRVRDTEKKAKAEKLAASRAQKNNRKERLKTLEKLYNYPKEIRKQPHPRLAQRLSVCAMQ